MSNSEFQPGQSINTDDAMNDMPTFAERVKNNVPEALEYLNQHPELKQKLASATSLLESLNSMNDEELEAQAEKSGAFLSTVETFNDITRRNQERANKLDELETRKLDGQLGGEQKENGTFTTAEEEYQAEIDKINNKYGEERSAENVLLSGEVDQQREAVQLEIADIKKAIEGLEMQKDDGNIWGEEYDKKKAELDAKLSDAEAKLEALSGGANAQEAADQNIEQALADKLDDLQTRKLDGEFSEEEYAEEVRKAHQAAAEGRLDALQNRADQDAEQVGTVLNQIIEDGKRELESAKWLHDVDDGYNTEEEYQEALKAAQDKIDNPTKYLAEYRTKVDNNPKAQALEGSFNDIANPEKMNPESLLNMANWYAKQDLAQKELAAEIAKGNPAALDWLEKHPAFKEDMDALIKTREDNLNKAAERAGDEEWQKFYDEYASDEDFRRYFGSQEDFDKAVRALYEDKLNYNADNADKILAEQQKKTAEDVGKMMEDGEEDVAPEKKGLFSKLKGFFNRSNRTKEGKKNAAKKYGLHGWKKAVMTVMLGLSIMRGLAGCAQIPPVNQPTAPQEAIVNEVSDNVDVDVDTESNTGSDADTQRQEQLLQKAAEQSLEVDMEDETLKSINVIVDGENLEIDTSTDLWDGESDFYTEVGDEMGLKQGKYNIVSKLYDMQNAGNMTKAEIGEQGLENLYGRSSDFAEAGQFAMMAGSDFVLNGDTDGITNLNEMNHVMQIAQSDEDARELMHGSSVNVLNDLFDGQEVKLVKHEQGESHGSLYIVDVDGSLQYVWQDETNPAKEDFYAVTSEKLNSNEAGGYKDRYLRAVGVIPSGASEDEAKKIMEKYDIEISLKCGQVILVTVDNPDTGDEKTTKETSEKETKETDEKTTSEKETKETDEKTTKETDEKTTKETDEKTTKETDEKTTKETDEKTTKETSEKETNEKTTNEKTTNEKTTNEKVTNEKVTNEKITDEKITNEKVTSEKETNEKATTEYDGKTDILPGEEGDGWTQREVTPEDETPRSEAGEENGYVNDNTPGSSAENITIPVEEKNEDATEPTDATYSEDTSGWRDEVSNEEGTQNIEEPSTPEEVNAINDSEANQESAADNNTPEENQNDVNEAMNRFDNGE